MCNAYVLVYVRESIVATLDQIPTNKWILLSMSHYAFELMMERTIPTVYQPQAWGIQRSTKLDPCYGCVSATDLLQAPTAGPT